VFDRRERADRYRRPLRSAAEGSLDDETRNRGILDPDPRQIGDGYLAVVRTPALLSRREFRN
jgi:hypothetical protein